MPCWARPCFTYFCQFQCVVSGQKSFLADLAVSLLCMTCHFHLINVYYDLHTFKWLQEDLFTSIYSCKHMCHYPYKVKCLMFKHIRDRCVVVWRYFCHAQPVSMKYCIFDKEFLLMEIMQAIPHCHLRPKKRNCLFPVRKKG